MLRGYGAGVGGSSTDGGQKLSDEDAARVDGEGRRTGINEVLIMSVKALQIVAARGASVDGVGRVAIRGKLAFMLMVGLAFGCWGWGFEVWVLLGFDTSVGEVDGRKEEESESIKESKQEDMAENSWAA
ncbi:uncharacterized protein A4U43_C04F22790 [Asparagus officinalis]|uniref:Uncharacterized protein n=1 Tax=Asparagus officinalis TaxID=4686 RepID=A0A5P1F7X2_ASPOF|nr:uncharacterized protein A4U43_C04F22790 [Asparagus officinalis]